MSAKKYHVELSVAERVELEQMLRSGKYSAHRLTRARILLESRRRAARRRDCRSRRDQPADRRAHPQALRRG